MILRTVSFTTFTNITRETLSMQGHPIYFTPLSPGPTCLSSFPAARIKAREAGNAGGAGRPSGRWTVRLSACPSGQSEMGQTLSCWGLLQEWVEAWKWIGSATIHQQLPYGVLDNTLQHYLSFELWLIPGSYQSGIRTPGTPILVSHEAVINNRWLAFKY